MTQSRSYSLLSCVGIMSAVSVLLYCAGFVRVEIKLNEQDKRMNELEELLTEIKRPATTASQQDLDTSLTGKLVSTVLERLSLIFCVFSLRTSTD